MKIIYGFSGCSKRKHKEILGGVGANAALKYHNLLINGLALNGVQVNCYSGLPINRSNYKKIFAFERIKVNTSKIKCEQKN